MARPRCDFHGCEEPICEENEAFDPPTLRFCQEHRAEWLAVADDLFENGNPATVIQFWIRAGGGPERMARGPVPRRDEEE